MVFLISKKSKLISDLNNGGGRGGNFGVGFGGGGNSLVGGGVVLHQIKKN